MSYLEILSKSLSSVFKSSVTPALSDDSEVVELTSPSVPEPHQIFEPTINRVPIPNYLITSEDHLVIPGVLEITQYNFHAYLLAHDKTQEKNTSY